MLRVSFGFGLQKLESERKMLVRILLCVISVSCSTILTACNSCLCTEKWIQDGEIRGVNLPRLGDDWPQLVEDDAVTPAAARQRALVPAAGAAGVARTPPATPARALPATPADATTPAPPSTIRRLQDRLFNGIDQIMGGGSRRGRSS